MGSGGGDVIGNHLSKVSTSGFKVELGPSHIYDHWLRAKSTDFGSHALSPVVVDCSKCHMVRPRGLTRDLGPFRQDLKCCTFDPFLPSFTLGAPNFEQKVSSEVLKDYLARRRLTPLGALPRTADSVNSPRANSICESGKDPKMACVFLSKDENAKCTIHEFRPSSCAGYMCHTGRGVSGFKEWATWETKINSFEWTLAHLSAFELGFTLDDIEVEFSSQTLAMEFYRRAFVTALEISL